MKKSFVLTTFFVVGATAASAGAVSFATTPYVGSDTLYNVTNQAIKTAGLGNTTWDPKTNPIGDYTGGGSGGGETAMVGNKQQTAPMSRALAGKAGPPASGACAATDLTQASNIVIGIDSLSVFASAAVINATGTCNGASSDPLCTPNQAGLVYSGGALGFSNWRDALALLYGGLDRSTGVTDCASSKRQTLVSNWSNLFQGACPNAVGGAALTHAWRRDDLSGTADVFSNLIGIQAASVDANGNAIAGFAVSPSAVNSFGTSPYCNSMNWDPAQVKAGACTGVTQYVGPGGVFTSDNIHHVPPAGAWGTVAAGLQPYVLPVYFQDNDPLRSACVGAGTAGRAGEDVCNADGKLGVVLPIPALDFIHNTNPNLVAYPSAVQCTSGYVFGDAPKVFQCAPRGNGVSRTAVCPNNDSPLGGNNCFVPIGPGSTGPTSQCLAIKAETPSCFTGPCGTDGRVYNLQGYDGNGSDVAANVHYLSIQIAQTPPKATQNVNFTGGYGRIHMRELSKGGTHVCQLDDATDQIACLVQADPSSVGFAGKEGATWEQRDPKGQAGSNQTVAVRVNQLGGGTACTPVAPGSANPSYPLWRKLYFNSVTGFARVTNTAELQLGQFQAVAANIDPILTTYGYLPLPFSPNGTDSAGNPNPFCEDFNQTSLCGVAGNTNACNSNVGLTSTFGTIPSDPSATPSAATTSTVCGNGIIEDFEDCDPAAPASSPSCSSTCRSTL